MTKRDPRYNAIGALIKTRRIRSWKGIFKYLPKTIVRHDFGFSYDRMDRLIHDPSDFELREINQLAGWIGIEGKTLAYLVIKMTN